MLAIRRQTRVRTRAWWFIACLPAICLLGIWYGKIVEASAPATPRMTEQVDSSGLPPPLSSLLIPNDTPTGTPTPCGPSTDYTIATATATIVPGTVDIGLHCGSCLTNIALPFPVVFYGTTFSSANVGTNSTVQFSSANASGASVCLPDAGFNNAIIPLWRNLRTD